MPKINPLMAKSLIVPLEGNIKKLLKLQKLRDGRNSLPKLNSPATFQNLLKVLTTAKIMH